MVSKVVVVALLGLLGVAVAKRIQDQGVGNGKRGASDGAEAGASQEQVETEEKEAWSGAHPWKEYVKLATNEVSQEQIDLALKEAEELMADADFRKQFHAIEEQVDADPQLQKQLQAIEEELSADPNIQKRLALVQKETDAMAAEQPSPSLLEVGQDSDGSWSMRQALAMLLLASDGTNAYHLSAGAPSSHVSASHSKASSLHTITMQQGFESGEGTRDSEPDANAPKYMSLADYQASKKTGDSLLTDYLAKKQGLSMTDEQRAQAAERMRNLASQGPAAPGSEAPPQYPAA